MLIFLAITANFIPPLQAPDEPVHAARSLEVALGKIQLLEPDASQQAKGLLFVNLDFLYKSIDLAQANSTGSQNSYGHQKELLKSKKLKELYSEIPSPGLNLRHQMIGYTGLNYWPQALSMKLGMIFNSSFLTAYQIGRFLQQLTGAIVFGYCLDAFIRAQCWSGLSGAVILSLPMSMFLISSLSGDAVILESAILMAICLEGLLLQKPVLGSKYFSRTARTNNTVAPYIILSLSFAWLASKASYIPLAASQAAIAFFHSRKSRLTAAARFTRGIAASFCLTILIFSLAWLSYTEAPLRQVFSTRIPIELQASRKQLVYSLNGNFIGIINNTISRDSQTLANQAIGVLGSLDKPLISEWLYTAIKILAGCCLIIPILGEPQRPSSSEVAWNLLIAVVLLVSAILSGYLVLGAIWSTWTSKASLVVEGLQGRHLLPLTPIFSVIMSLAGTAKGILPRSNHGFSGLASRLSPRVLAKIILLGGCMLNFWAYLQAVGHWYL